MKENITTECINRAELLGTVGRANTTIVENKKMVRFSIVTERAYKTTDGTAVIETTWHNVVAFEGDGVDVDTLNRIDRGVHVHLWGRIRPRRYTNESGEDRTVMEIVCNKLKIV